ncbi:hypothetical protein QU38_00590, partial [Staphylococcus aureus]
DDGRGFEDWAEGPSFHHPVRSRGGDGCSLPAAHPAAAGRLPLCVAAVGPASDLISATPLPAATRHLPSAGRRGRQAEAPALQTLPDRLLPQGHRRGANCRRHALSVRRHRPRQQVRRHATRRQGRHARALIGS